MVGEGEVPAVAEALSLAAGHVGQRERGHLCQPGAGMWRSMTKPFWVEQGLKIQAKDTGGPFRFLVRLFWGDL